MTPLEEGEGVEFDAGDVGGGGVGQWSKRSRRGEGPKLCRIF